MVLTSDVRWAAAQPSTRESRFEAIFRGQYDAVYRLLYRIAGTRDAAEDLAQETFLRLHGAPHIWAGGATSGVSQPDAAGGLRAWLYRVATNLAFNALRSRARREGRQTSIEDAETVAGDGDSDPAAAALRQEERAAVRRALAGLPKRQAQLLLLRYSGLSYRELAEALNVAPGSIGTLLARAEEAFERVYRRG